MPRTKASSVDGSLSEDEIGGDSGRSRSIRGGKKAVVAEDLGGQVDAAELRRCKRVILQASQDPQMARRLAHLIEEGKLQNKKAKPTGDYEVLLPCSNKYNLLGQERIRKLLKNLCEDLDMKDLELLKLDDLKQLLNYALALCRQGCSLPSKVWGQCVAGAKERYEDVGGNRLSGLIFEKKGDKKAPYVEVNYQKKGCYELLTTERNRKKFVKLRHVGGPIAKLSPPLDSDSYIVNNDDDWQAKIVSDKMLMEVLCHKVFAHDGQGDKIPELLADERVGQARSPVKKVPLALLDKVTEDAPGGESPPPSIVAPKAVPSTRPRGSGRSSASAGPPPKKSKTA